MSKDIVIKSMEWNTKLLQAELGERFMSLNTKNKLDSEISMHVKLCLIEYPYVDKDFRDTFYNDFSKRHIEVSRDSIRVHLFNATKKYLGFFTLRDTSPFNIGRSCLHPKAIKHSVKGFYCLDKFEANVRGKKLLIMSFPWMQQDVNVTRCAHIAMWTVIRYFSNKFGTYKEYTLQSLSNLSDSSSRKVPSRGLTVEQIAQTMTRAGFSTEIYMKATMPDIDNIFRKVCYAMIESGLPFVAGLLGKSHAISILGHGQLDVAQLGVDAKTADKKIFDIADYVNEFISNNDNYLPYAPVNNSGEGIIMDDIDVIIVPLHEKMYLDIIHLYERVIPGIETMLDPSKKLIRRAFITSSKSFKSFVAKSSDSIYSGENLKILMPKFVWVLEYFELDKYPSKVSYRFVIDATGAKYKTTELILTAKLECKLFVGGNMCDLEQEYEDIYIGNLKEIA